jgi:hypothetical protein
MAKGNLDIWHGSQFLLRAALFVPNRQG